MYWDEYQPNMSAAVHSWVQQNPGWTGGALNNYPRKAN